MKKAITFIILIHFFSFKTDNRTNSNTQNQVEVKQQIKKTDSNIEIKYVIAKSGLNYRKNPKGEIIGKLEYGEKVEVIEHSNIFENITDSHEIIIGEWLGIKINNDKVYIFGGYLSEDFDTNQLFEWNNEMCIYLSVFDSEMYNRNEIENCYKIIFEYHSLSNSPWVFKVSDIEKLNENDLKTEYLTKIDLTRKLILPKKGKWQEYKEHIITELKESYKLYSISYKAYMTKDFEVLNEFWESDTLLEEYSKGLQGTDDQLLKAWEKLTANQAKKNSSPETVWARYRDMRNYDNWKEHAQIQIMTFGWRNAANKHINRFEGDKYHREFHSLFISTKEIDCEEP